MPRVPLLLVLFLLPLIVGCEGCRRDREEASEEEETILQDFTALPTLAFPADTNVAAGGIKPGHWLTASQGLKSNKVDARGELESRSSASATNIATGDVEQIAGELPSVRPVVLPKGQSRRFDFRLLAPVTVRSDQRRIYLSSRFVSRGRAVLFDTGRQPYDALSTEEYFFVVLTTRPQRFTKFQVSDWVRPFHDELSFKDKRSNFRIVFPPTDDLLPLAETMLDWTSTSVVVWDDLSPDALTPLQQRAMADWVRFGGQLVVNGADATEAIAATSLIDLLPLRPTGNIELEPDAATELLRQWSVVRDPTTDQQVALLRGQAGRVAIDGQIDEDAQPLPNTANLVLTRRVGNGRVVQSRFDITSDWMVNWQSYDSFVNSAILARPRRKIVRSSDPLEGGVLQQQYVDHQMTSAVPAMNTKFRIAARDAVLPTGSGAVGRIASLSGGLTAGGRASGIGGWNDSSDTLRLYREILQGESGIEIPDSSLVVRSLGYYLLILVPLNYLVFRFLGRLEYAWLAVPLIAVVGAVWVARAARLDIGFARKQTELALLELQPNYHRGHLSRVVAIYNSLSSSYDVEFKTIDGVAAPIWEANTSDPPRFRTAFAEGPLLSGLAVDSNKTQMLHAEQMIDVGGAISLDADGNLVNRTEFELFDAVVIDKSDPQAVRIAMVGPCPPGSKNVLRYRAGSTPAITDDLPMQTVRVIRRMASPAAMLNGSLRLVARIDASLPGMTIAPAANQVDAQTIVLAHLKYPAMPTPKADANLITDFRKAIGRDEDEFLQDEENP